MKKLIAIDGNSLMHRAYYALPAMTTKTGVPTGAIYGFLNMLLKLTAMEPDYLVVAFDMHGPTFRHEMLDEYKAGRRETPEDLRPQFPELKSLLIDMGIAVCECERYEADDILGTFARIANESGVEAILVTGDRDALQLVREHTRVLLTKKGITDVEEYDPAALMEKYGLAPERMVDLKGLMGDNSDNIPGVPGVGEKTALKLLTEYGSLEETLLNADKVKGKLGEKLREFAEQARFSYQLGRIDVNAPLTMGLADCAFVPERMANALPHMHALELRAIISRIPAGEGVSHAPVAAVEVTGERVADADALSALAKKVQDAPALALTFGETMGVSTSSDREYEIVFEGTLLDPGLTPGEAVQAMKPALSEDKTEKYLFDAKQAMHMLREEGISLGKVGFDAMIADYLLHATHPADTLDALCREQLGSEKGSAARLYALVAPMKEELKKQELMQLYEEVELPLTRVLFDMECEGFLVDRQILREMGEDFQLRIEKLNDEIAECAGERFNPLSHRQLGTILFEKLGLPVQKKIKTGYSTNAEVLERLQDMHPIVPLVQEYRFLSKIKSTFIDGLLALTSEGGRIHSRFNQNVAATGRISSAEPNLQNIPVRTALGREIRKAFIASPGNLLVGADYSQIELRLLAHMSGDEGMIRAFNSGADIHASTAAEVFGVPLSEVTKEQRSAAKAVNFGIVYGISDYGLAQNLGISRAQASEYIKKYFERYPGVQAYLKESVASAKRDGYAKTLLGRRRELPELKSGNFNTRSFGERVAMNMPLQGTAADIIKLAMIRVHDALEREGLKAKLILQIHDELILDTHEAEVEQVKELLRREMENVMQLRVPLSADVNVGRSWYDTK
ncbi:MAG: DNA polymerase I [Clostridia bacterium]|nr:DNA polymerase I [Clostridia bacterium]